METLSFTFGMLSMIGAALVAVVVVGMLRVIKLQKILDRMERVDNENHKGFHRRVDYEVENLTKIIDNDRRELNQRIDEAYRYVDSRFDKMENKFIGASAAKQVIKG